MTPSHKPLARGHAREPAGGMAAAGMSLDLVDADDFLGACALLVAACDVALLLALLLA